MNIKRISRTIPEERENNKARFRVKYNNRSEFDVLLVTITRIKTGEKVVFEFKSQELPERDSIYFTTSVDMNTFKVTWQNTEPSTGTKSRKESTAYLRKNENSQSPQVGKVAFSPISDASSKILILGTMPGEKSLSMQQYYGHAGNHFWKIIFSLFDEPFIQEYEDRKKLLLAKKIALWDVLSYAEGEGSLDSAIVNEKANDFDAFYANHPSIKHIFFASKQAAKYYDKYVKRNLDFRYHVLPSPSRMNSWKTFEEKVDDWKEILKYLED